jgi:HSP20 family protein
MALFRNSSWPTPRGYVLSDFSDDEGLFNAPWSYRGQRSPAVNVKDTDKVFEVEVAAPGFNKKDFRISVDEGMLTVAAESEQETEKKEENYTWREFGYSSFSRSFNLPANTNEEDYPGKIRRGCIEIDDSQEASSTIFTEKIHRDKINESCQGSCPWRA